jgi:hypothetical protein
MTEEPLTDIRDFFMNEEVFAFVLSEIDELRPWDRFKELAMPAQLSPEQMWEVLEFIRYVAYGVPFLFQEHTPQRSWYGISPEIQSLLNFLSYQARSDGSLSRKLRLYLTRHGYVPGFLIEVTAIASRENLDIDYDTVRQLRLGIRVPVTEAELLVSNVLRLHDELPAYLDWPFGSKLFGELSARLNKGLNEVPYTPMRHLGTDYDAYDFYTLEHIHDIRLAVERGELHPILATLYNSEIIWNGLLFSRWTNFMELLLRELIFLDNCPVLCHVPLHKPILDWEMDGANLMGLPHQFGKAILVSSFGLNVMPYYQQLLNFLKQGLAGLTVSLEREYQQVERAKELIREDFRLNHRQQQLLIRLIEDPRSPVDAPLLQKEFDIVPSTAHMDLDKLVSMGFLSLTVKGKKKIFTPTPSLINLD